jgi:hypothetical protein
MRDHREIENRPQRRENGVFVNILIGRPVSGIAAFWPLFGMLQFQGLAVYQTG